MRKISFRLASHFSVRFVFTGLLACTAGCALTPLARHTAAFATATALVVHGSQDAYRTANRLYFDEQVSSAVLQYDKQPTFDPRSITPLLTTQQMHVRDSLLDALQRYAENLDEIENAPGKATGLDAAAAGVGNNLLAMNTSLRMDFSSAKGAAMTQTQANILSTSVEALGRFLIARKVKRELPSMIVALDPAIEQICKVFEVDIATLQSQAHNDYSQLLSQQDLFIRNPLNKMDAVERRAEIRQLPLILQASRDSDALLTSLKVAIERLALAHHSLAEAAQGNNPEVLRARIGDLMSSGQQLASFYQTLPK